MSDQLYLIGAKERVGHGRFLEWIKAAFRWSERTAQRFMSVAAKFKYDTVSHLPIDLKALYLLAEKKTSRWQRWSGPPRRKASCQIENTSKNRGT